MKTTFKISRKQLAAKEYKQAVKEIIDDKASSPELYIKLSEVIEKLIKSKEET